ncbi:hypothetical protein BDP67DRAFT_412408 [Colletotrichum lupini]|nr:hypothetical protein BDP67DRAFT_412408 [Colletotrichum lupini]
MNSERIVSRLNILRGNEKTTFLGCKRSKALSRVYKLLATSAACETLSKAIFRSFYSYPNVRLNLAQRSILRALEFNTMYYCYDTICDAHEKTFRWILADDFDERCNKLTRWLSSVSGVFHFSAKLGAGKSTVMKMIINHGESQKGLDTWAGDKTLVCAKFFFWNSGSERQRSVSGLYLGLLHEVLSAHPDLTPHDLPSFWETVYTSSWPAGERMHISPSQALQGLDRLFRGSDISQNYRFCLFIDGLGELHETTECSYSDLTEMIYRWSSLTSRLTSYD